MVLENIIDPKEIIKKPSRMFFIGIVFALFAVALSYWVFKTYVSLIMISFIAIASVPFIHKIMEIEEDNDIHSVSELSLLGKHSRVVELFVFMFLGFTVAFIGLYVFLPLHMVEVIFNSQIATITAIHSSPTGNFFAFMQTFSHIFFNNLKILVFCAVFSFFYGVGAIFILSWNASVMGAAVGIAIREGLGMNKGVFHVVFSSLAGYAVHGIPEVMAYFFAGLAGGVISVAVFREDFLSDNFNKVVKDALVMIGVAAVILVAAAIIEIFISPLLF